MWQEHETIAADLHIQYLPKDKNKYRCKYVNSRFLTPEHYSIPRRQTLLAKKTRTDLVDVTWLKNVIKRCKSFKLTVKENCVRPASERFPSVRRANKVTTDINHHLSNLVQIGSNRFDFAQIAQEPSNR